MVLNKQFVVLSMVVSLLAIVDVRNGDDGDDVMNDTVMPDDGRPWVMFVSLLNFDTLVDDPKRTKIPSRQRQN